MHQIDQQLASDDVALLVPIFVVAADFELTANRSVRVISSAHYADECL